jgi:dTMP kinase
MQFVVIEGLDGSGKSTQLELLKAALGVHQVPFQYLHFPRLEVGHYGKLIARFLRGEMGANDQVDPYLVALLFAGDRADAASLIRKWKEEGTLVIVDRYVYSNIAFQCAKLKDQKEKDQLMDWILDFEYSYHRLPRPDLNLFLNVPLDFIRSQLGSGRTGEDRDYLRGVRDIHEESLDFQEQVRQMYLILQQRVDDLVLVDCTDDKGHMLSPGSISEKIVSLILQKP